MSVTAEMRSAVIELAGPRDVFDTRERWLSKAAHAAGINLRTAKAFFYEEIADPRSSVVEAIRAARAKKAKENASELSARDELKELRERVARLEYLLRQSDPHAD